MKKNKNVNVVNDPPLEVADDFNNIDSKESYRDDTQNTSTRNHAAGAILHGADVVGGATVDLAKGVGGATVDLVEGMGDFTKENFNMVG